MYSFGIYIYIAFVRLAAFFGYKKAKQLLAGHKEIFPLLKEKVKPGSHPAISSSVVPVSSCPQSLPVSESFPMSQLFARGGQSTGVSALASVLPKNTQD